MTRMTGPDCAVMRNFINTHTLSHIHTHNDMVGLLCYAQFNKYTYTQNTEEDRWRTAAPQAALALAL